MIDTAGGSTSAPEVEAAIPASTSPTAVNLRCRCPGSPHPYDVVTLRAEASNRMGIAVAAAGQRAVSIVASEAELGVIFMAYGIESWTFTDGEPVPCETPIPEAVLDRWLPWHDGGYTVAQAANALYAEDVFRPFLETLKTRSPDGAETNSTSATTGSGPTPLKHYKRSSRTSSAGKRSIG